MNKTPRFVKEYASYVIKCDEHNELMRQEIKDESRKRIEFAIRKYEKGYISTDEVMRFILNSHSE